MKKLFLLSLMSLLLLTKLNAQNLDSLKQLVDNGKDDTLKVQRLNFLSSYKVYSNPDTGLLYARNALNLSQKIGYRTGEAIALNLVGSNLNQLGDYWYDLRLHFTLI